MSKEEELTADEIALYDRQIRLWGMATQLRLRSAKVLIINIGALGTEIVKNLVLGGLNTIELLDGSVVKEENFGAQFFLPNNDEVIGSLKLPLIIDKIMDLNKRVTLSINTASLTSLLEDESYFQKFDLIIATELDKQSILKLNELTRRLKVPLYVAGLHGLFGYIITDLIEHESVSEKDSGNQLRVANSKINRCKTITDVKFDKASNKETITILDEYCPISQIFSSAELPKQLNRRQLKKLSSALPLIFTLFEFDRPTRSDVLINREDIIAQATKVCESLNVPSTVITDQYLDAFVQQAFTEFSPVAAILGGTLAQDVVQFLSRRESPINNVLILDSIKSEMPIYLL